MFNEELIKSVKPDPRGRIPLGLDIIGDADRFHVLKLDDGDIILRPYVEVPKKELWLLRDGETMVGIRKSFKQAEDGKLSKLDMSMLEGD